VGYGEPIAVPAEWAVDSAVAVRYAAVVDRVVGRLEAALLSGVKGVEG
jgi:hypothetical protein